MRYLRNGYGLPPTIKSTTLNGWDFARASSSAAAVDIKNLISATSYNNVGTTQHIVGLKSASFNGTNQYFSSSRIASLSTWSKFNADWTMHFMFTAEEPLGDVSPILDIVGNRETGVSENYCRLLFVSIDTSSSDWHLVCTFDYAASGSYSVDSVEFEDAVILEGVPYCATITYDYSELTYRLYLNGRLAGLETASYAPLVSATPSQGVDIGISVPDYGGSEYCFKGKIDYIYLQENMANLAEHQENVRRAMQLTTISKSMVQACVLNNTSSPDPDELDDYTNLCELNGENWVMSVDLDSSVDSNLDMANITLVKRSYELTPVPDVTNKLNSDRSSPFGSFSASNLLWLNQPVRIYANRIPAGYTTDDVTLTADWPLIFKGIVASIDWAGDQVVLRCYDQSEKLMSGYIQESFEPIAAADAVSDAIDIILAEAETEGWVEDSWAVVVGNDIGINVKPWVCERQPLLPHLVEIVEQFGFSLKYRWYEPSFDFVLLLYEVNRDDPNYQIYFSVDNWAQISAISTSIEDIRNIVTVSWPSEAYYASTSASGYQAYGGGKDGENQPLLAYVTVRGDGTNEATDSTRWNNDTDFDSIGTYGPRYCEINVNNTEHLQTCAGAEDLAVAVLKDLMRPLAVCSVEMNTATIETELDDVIGLQADDIHFSNDYSGGVVKCHHVWDSKGSRSIFDLRTFPCSGVRRHLRKEVRWLGGGAGVVTDVDYSGVNGQSNTNTLIKPKEIRQLENKTLVNKGGVKDEKIVTPNADFSIKSIPENKPPDGWAVVSGGAWDTDLGLESDDGESGNVRTGRFSIKIKG